MPFEDIRVTKKRVCDEKDRVRRGRYRDSCKTGFRPYDLAVQCVLLIAKHHLRDRIQVSSGEDYVRHLDSTHTGIMNPDGSMQMIFLPDLSGAVFYDTVERVWKVRPQGETIQLDMEDPFADDHDINSGNIHLPHCVQR